MATQEANSYPIELWKEGLLQLRKLDCKFIAIYGAEPTADFDNLCEFVKTASLMGFDMTLITSGQGGNIPEKLKLLYEAGLRSLTMSYDIVPLDPSSAIKSSKALKTLNYFGSLGPVDNLAICTTLTRKNYTKLYDSFKVLAELGYWTFFDIIHHDRGQEGSKVKGRDEELMFTEDDILPLITQLQLLKTNRDRLKIHASDGFLDYLCNNPELFLTYDWNCANSRSFPSWVTIDCDGQVYPCDDFQPKSIGVPFHQIADRWETFQDAWRTKVSIDCPGCIWNTHIDANLIKEGAVSINQYIHKDNGR